jgi:hypothetical protein
MAITEPSGLTTIEAGTEDAHEDYNDNMTRLNAQCVRYVRAQVGPAAGLNKHDTVYISAVDGKLYKAQATSDLFKMPCTGIIEETKAQDQWAKAILFGIVTDEAWSFTPGQVLVLSRDMEGEFNYLDGELSRDYSPFSVQQVLGFVISETSVFICVNRPTVMNAGVVRDLAFEESSQAAADYGNRGLLRVEDVDGTLELVYYDNGGARTVITSGGLLNTMLEMKNEGDYGWSEVRRLEFTCGDLAAKPGEPGTYQYTPPSGGNGGDGGDPVLFSQRQRQAIPNFGNTTVYQIGQGNHSASGTQTSADDADGCWHNFATTAVANNQAYLSNNASSSRRDHEETLIVRFKTAASIAAMRLWGAGWFSNLVTAGGADAPNIHIAAFRFSTNAGDTNWMAVTAGAGGVWTITDTGVAVAINTIYVFRIEFDETTPEIRFYINDVLVATHSTNLPDATTQIYYGISVTTLETVSKSFKWSRIARIGK